MKKLIAMLLLTSSPLVSAQTNTISLPPLPTLPIEISEKSTEDLLGMKKFEEATEITDSKLKAEAGSLSRYSLKFHLSYYGPTINDLSVKDQPNPDGSIGTYETALGGSIGARYRLSSTRSITAGSGLKAIYPFNGCNRVDLNNPYLNYDVLSKVAGIQMRNSPGISYVTVPNYKVVGQFASLTYDLGMVYNIGTSDVAIGLESNINYLLYNRDYIKKDKKAAQYNIAFFPNIKYNFTDNLNAVTSLSLNYWNARSTKSAFNLQKRTLGERLGLGYAITRDIYISPYLVFYPSKLATNTTTINLTTTFSLL